MTNTCPRCSRSVADSALGETAAFCMYCGQRLRPATDETVLRPVMAAPLSQLLSPPPDRADDTATRTGHADSSAPDRVPNDAPPAVIGGYRLLRFLGGGGMGSVYEAIDPHNGRRVAVKLLSRRLSSSPQSVERFRQEGRLASQLSHPRCVFVYRADTDAGQPFIVMELMPGRTLKDEVDARGRLPVGEAIGYMLDVIDGLIEAHRLGVIHRDVKPSNCFVDDDGRVKVGDFGLSKSLAGEAHALTQTGTFLGTVLFAPPEQIRHEPVGYDSDVYAVAATLYYLLLGQAPHQHDSLTAVLAKAISEPAPPLRPQRPDIPKELEKIVLKGLERDRTRRYQSLEEMRDALADLLPQNQTPAGPRALVMAYLIDVIIGYVSTLPFEVAQAFLFEFSQAGHQLVNMAGNVTFYFLYFTLFEGVWGATPGKMLFRLRVRRVGESGPPGLPRAALRTLAFQTVWWAPTLAAMGFGLAVGMFELWAALMPLCWLISLGVMLAVQLRRTTHGHRGPHDFAAGTHTVQKRLVARRARLVSTHPNPLDRTVPSTPPLPDRVGLFKLTGKLCDVDDGGQVWAGTDESLGRRLIVRVEPPGAGDDSRFDEPIVRPARLRAVGHGTIQWGGGERAWVAYVAPAGAPLPDVITPAAPLNWAVARNILEQVVQELVEGDQDGTPPALVVPEQVWVEPSGRVQVLDFPLPTGRGEAGSEIKTRYPGGTPDPFPFLRRLTTLMLEGQPRNTPHPLAAPLPSRAETLTADLMDDRFGTPADLGAALTADRPHPAEVTTGTRAGHLSTTAVLCSFWLFLMFFFAGFVNWFAGVGVSFPVKDKTAMLDALDTPEERQAWVAAAKAKAGEGPSAQRRAELFERWLAPDRAGRTEERVRAELAQAQAVLDDIDHRLNQLEIEMRKAVAKQNEHQFKYSPSDGNDLWKIGNVLSDLEDGKPPKPDDEFNESTVNLVTWWIGFAMACVIAQWPLLWWPLFALLFRGGIARLVAGLAFVRKDGRPASVWVCWLRSLLTWLPLLLALLLVILLQVHRPYWVYVRTVLWVLAIGVLPLMAVVALRRPDRTPLDRLFGTYIVPA
jgi:hypothetical protein